MNVSAPMSPSNARPGFSFCVCPDPERLRLHIANLLTNTGQKNWEHKVFWGDEDLPSSFWQHLSVPNLMGPPRALILRRAHILKVEFWKNLSPHLKGFRQSIWPFFCLEGAWNKGKPSILKTITSRPYWKVALDKSWVWQDPGITRNSLPKEVTAWANQRHITFASGVLQSFCQGLPLETFALHNELQKLALHLGDRTSVTQTDLQIFNHPLDIDMFTFLRSIQDKRHNLNTWKKIIVDQSSSGSELIFPFLGLLTWEVRTMWQLAAGEENAVRLPPTIKTSKKNMARQIGLPGIIRILDLILETEMNIKTGHKTPDQALECIVQQLMHIFS
jgi:DNA polymerase-3 subunit delta